MSERIRAQQKPITDVWRLAASASPKMNNLVPEQTTYAFGNTHTPVGTIPDTLVDAYSMPETFGGTGAVSLPEKYRAMYEGREPRTGDTDTDVSQTEGDHADAPPAVAPRPARVTPGGMQLTGRTTQKGIGVTDAEQANLDMGYDRQTQAVRDAALQGQARAVEEAEYAKAAADQHEQYAVEQQARQAARKQQVDARMAKLDALAGEIENGKVDPSRYLSNQNAGAKIATMLSVVLGAGAAQRINGRNVGLDMMNDAIARDIDAQKTALESKRAGYQAQNSLYAQMLRNFESEDAAKAAAHAAIIKGYEGRVAAIAAKYKGTEMGAKAEQTLGEMQSQFAKQSIDVRNATSDKVAEQETYRAPQVVGGGNGAIPGAMPLNEKNFVQTGENGEGFVAPDDASKLREGRAASKSLQDILKEAADLKDKASWWDNAVEAGLGQTPLGIHTENFRKRKQLEADALTKKTVLEGQGAMSKGDSEYSGQAIGNIMNITGDASEIRNASGRVQKIAENQVASAGGLTGRAVWVTDRNGVPRRVFVPTGSTTFDDARKPGVKVTPVGARK